MTKDEVEEAHYLFEISTMKTIEGSKEFGLEISPNLVVEVQKIEELIKKRMPIGNQTTTEELISRLVPKFSNVMVGHAISNMIKNG